MTLDFRNILQEFYRIVISHRLATSDIIFFAERPNDRINGKAITLVFSLVVFP
jgi:hypothetical protein